MDAEEENQPQEAPLPTPVFGRLRLATRTAADGDSRTSV